jgi:hypothetical protein
LAVRRARLVAVAAEDRLNIRRHSIRTPRLRQPAIAEQSQFMSSTAQYPLHFLDELNLFWTAVYMDLCFG